MTDSSSLQDRNPGFEVSVKAGMAQGVLARVAARRDGGSPARHAHDRRRHLDAGAAPASREALRLRAARPARRDAGVRAAEPEVEAAEPADQKCYLLNT